MTDHSFKERVQREAQELQTILTRLQAFIGGTVYHSLPRDEQSRLSDQEYHMRRYHAVLLSRIAHFDD